MNATITTTAPVTAPKGKTTRKAQTVAAKPAQTFNAIKYVIEDFAKPKSGNALFALTAAWLTMSGISIAPVPRKAATQVIGARAISYHLEKGNFEMTEKGVKLTDKGAEFFAARSVDPELFAAFQEVMTTGKLNELANVKTSAARVPFKA